MPRPRVFLRRSKPLSVAMRYPACFRNSAKVLATMVCCLLGVGSCRHSGAEPASSCSKSGSPLGQPQQALTLAQQAPCGLPTRLFHPEWPKVLPSTLEQEREPMPAGATTVVLLPDVQYYTSCRYPHLKNQSAWIANQRAERNILAAIALGDLTDHNIQGEWEFLRESFAALPEGFPLLLTTGNHDVGEEGATNSRDSLISKYFDETWAKANHGLLSVMTPGSIENAFYAFDSGKVRLGVLMLEWSPRKVAVDWANRVLSEHPDLRVIVATHAYVYDDSTRYDHVGRPDQHYSPYDYATAQGAFAADGNHDGEMLWNALIRRHPGIFLVVSGHVLGQGTGRLTSRGDAGNAVQQILVNYQMLDEGGLGYLRFFEIYPDGRTLHMKTYSPSLGLYSYAADQDFRLEVDPPLWRE